MSERTLSDTLDLVMHLFGSVNDRQGVPYWRHCFWVMAHTESQDRDVLHAALLHDVVEDTDWTLEDLKTEGYTDRTVHLVDLLSRRPGETYAALIDRVCTDRDAILIKLADNAHNTWPTRGNASPRYAKARAQLNSALTELSA